MSFFFTCLSVVVIFPNLNCSGSSLENLPFYLASQLATVLTDYKYNRDSRTFALIVSAEFLTANDNHMPRHASSARSKY